MLMKERLSYKCQLDEKSMQLTKEDQLIEELRKDNEAIVCHYICGYAYMHII